MRVTTFKYLGNRIDCTANCSTSIKERIQAVSMACNVNAGVVKNKLLTRSAQNADLKDTYPGQ